MQLEQIGALAERGLREVGELGVEAGDVGVGLRFDGGYFGRQSPRLRPKPIAHDGRSKIRIVAMFSLFTGQLLAVTLGAGENFRLPMAMRFDGGGDILVDRLHLRPVARGQSFGTRRSHRRRRR